MKFSVCLSTGFEGVMYPIPFAGPDDFIRQAKRCEELGYHSVWGNDHITTQNYVRDLFPGTPPNFYDPLIVLAAIAGATSKIKIGTAITVLPMHDPVYLAKQAVTLDQMSGGRFIMAVGLGAYREEFEAWAGNRFQNPRRGDMMDEGLEAMHRLFNEARASFDGKYYSYKDVEMFPKSIAQPFPIYIGGHNTEAMERAVKYGQGWLPGWQPLHVMEDRIATLKRRAAEAGRAPGSIEIAPQLSCTIDKTMELAEKRYMESGLVAHRVSLAYTGRDLSHQVTANLVGSPEVILEKIEKLRSIGVEHVSALMFPANSVAELDEQIEWFAREVMAKVPQD
ncbi:LLM class flavin-dependent oxidoreductase [Ramlibacter tataouinensis]|uniref:LLM class flavin-dependent oxidoreductase n=1 Tax=Ramlibacter tataouinensis TaxID=94132 RepID=UPI0022F3FDE0|nr:LLM class flavin-dependent oxidoreductase [Ramlibacter tataouinensis]WBY00533.1 LLM class flavin-dependent oxidoreductase [Ramlibacter tataouinensis]